jgi:acyl-coenzyme A synthetase/AMP-(fatty) acid ligase
VIERHRNSPAPNVGPNDLCRKFWLAVMIRGSVDDPVRDGEGCRGQGVFVSGDVGRVDAD